MRIVSFAAIKGGVGKTTLTYNFGEWLADRGYKVLMIDNDHQCSLTQQYNIFTNDNTVADIYKQNGIEPEIKKVNHNLDLIPSSLGLEELNDQLQFKENKAMLLFMWLADHYSDISAKYDYILIDCHPDFSTITKNAIAISDYIISPIEPSQYGFSSKGNLLARLKVFKEELIDVRTRKSYINAEPLFIANRMLHNTKSSRELSEVIENDDDITETIPNRELFNRSTLDNNPLSEMKKDKLKYQKHKAFFDQIDTIFESLRQKIDGNKGA